MGYQTPDGAGGIKVDTGTVTIGSPTKEIPSRPMEARLPKALVAGLLEAWGQTLIPQSNRGDRTITTVGLERSSRRRVCTRLRFDGEFQTPLGWECLLSGWHATAFYCLFVCLLWFKDLTLSCPYALSKWSTTELQPQPSQLYFGSM